MRLKICSVCWCFEDEDGADSERVLQEPRRVNVDVPTWVIDSLDREARKLGVRRQSVTKVWLAERLEASTIDLLCKRNSSGSAHR